MCRHRYIETQGAHGTRLSPFANFCFLRLMALFWLFFGWWHGSSAVSGRVCCNLEEANERRSLFWQRWERVRPWHPDRQSSQHQCDAQHTVKIIESPLNLHAYGLPNYAINLYHPRQYTHVAPFALRCFVLWRGQSRQTAHLSR